MTRSTAILLGVVAAAVVLMAWLMRTAREPADEEPTATEVSVHAARLERRTLHRYVSVYGVVEPRPASKDDAGGAVSLAAPVTGLVAQVLCSEGERVDAGQVLVQLDTRPIDVEIARAREQLRFADEQYTRQQKLLEVDGTSERALQEAREAMNVARDQLTARETQRALLQVVAPFGGVVARIRARPGQSVDPTITLVELVDPEDLVVTVGVPAQDLGRLHAGQPVRIASAAAAAAITSTLTFVSPQIDSRTGTALARASVPADSGLRAGQYVDVDIEVEQRPDRLVAPAASVVKNEDDRMVVAVIDGSRAIQVPVEAGLRDGAWVEIEGGDLEAGDLVVTVGAYGLPRETNVRVVAD